MNFTVYKSSAGSGKTFTLVKEYLKIALGDEENPPVKYRHILAVTFTNKAAAEMKERILKALAELSEGKAGSKLAQLLSDEMQLAPALLTARAGRLLKAILHHYGDFAVGTIDSFVHRIVRTFAFDLQLPVNFEIETDSEMLLREAVDLLITRIGTDDKLTEFLVQFAESKADDERNWHIEYELLQNAKHLLGEDGFNRAERLQHLSLDDFSGYRDTLKTETERFAQEVTAIAQGALKAIQGIDHSAFYQGNKGVKNWLEEIVSGEIAKAGKPGAYVTAAFEQDKRYAQKASAEIKDQVDRAWPYLEKTWNDLRQLSKKSFGKFTLYSLLLRNIHALAVLSEIEKQLVQYKAENNVLHISEFNRLIAGIVLSEPVPFIYERLGERYQHYLLDEFQDTSALQWQNLLPLIDNALSENRFTMLVGDGKQAIYRWRGGEVEQFAQLPQVKGQHENPFVADRAENLQRHYKAEKLARNFRSKAEIVQFNNDFFEILSKQLETEHQLIYEDTAQEYNPANTGGYVHLELIEADRKQEKEMHVNRSCALIEELAGDGFRYNEIAILTRTNREGSLIASALMEKGIPVVSSESLLLKNSPKVNFLVALLRYLETSRDDIARVSVVRFLVDAGKLPGTLHERLMELREEDKKGLPGLLERNGFPFSAYFLSKLPLYQRCQELLRLFGIGQDPDPYLLYFLDEVLQYATGRNNNPSDFLTWWNEKRDKASVVMPEGMNAVNIMTIHKAKGLEFPAVIIPFCKWSLKPGKSQLWLELHEDALPGLESALVPASADLLETEYGPAYAEESSRTLLDNLNLLYVALTRPEKRLYVLTGKGSSKGTLNSVSDLFGQFFREKQISFSGTGFYAVGKTEPHRPAEQEESVTLVPDHFGNEDWTGRISIRSNSGAAWAEMEAGNDRQVLLNTLLLRAKTEDDLKPVLAQMMQEGLLSQAEEKQLLQQAGQLIRVPLLAPCFDAKNEIRTGSEILLPDGSFFRPDRVADDGKEIHLAGYGDAGDEMLTEELKKYTATLKEMSGRPVTAMIIDTASLMVEEVL
ncbi:MAG: UvrD/REP helicase [Bacteroidetes bacterium]|nr:MAG: UvrD/REP helicase [Bacteroidota bacterium]